MTDVTELLAGWRRLADSVDGWAYSDSREDEAFSRDAREPFARLLDAVQAVRSLHRPYAPFRGGNAQFCRECEGDELVPWPCRTVRVITDTLTAVTGDTE